MTAESLRIPARDGGAFEAWVAAPPSGRGPGLIVLAEIYNALDFLRQHLGGEAS